MCTCTTPSTVSVARDSLTITRDVPSSRKHFFSLSHQIWQTNCNSKPLFIFTVTLRQHH